jgi:hypothetical protein
LAVFLLPPLLLSGWDAFWAPYKFQLDRRPFPPTIYRYILADRLEEQTMGAKAFRLGSVLVTILAASLYRPPTWESLLRRGAIVLLVFLALAVFYSPQWIIWLSPLLIPLARRDWKLVALIIALDLLTFTTFPLVMGTQTPEAHWLWGPLVYVRFAILGLLGAALVWAELRPPVPAMAPLAKGTLHE